MMAELISKILATDEGVMADLFFKIPATDEEVLETTTKNAREAQLEMLRKILERNGRVEYLQRHGLNYRTRPLLRRVCPSSLTPILPRMLTPLLMVTELQYCASTVRHHPFL